MGVTEFQNNALQFHYFIKKVSLDLQLICLLSLTLLNKLPCQILITLIN